MTMMNRMETIRKTLGEIASAAETAAHTIALVGAGSAGLAMDRMDAYSDLDFFLIIEDGYSSSFINDNSWFGKSLPIDFEFRDTEHGNKVLLHNGVFLEFAIFTLDELARYGIPGLRTIWSKPGFTLPEIPFPQAQERDISYYVNQALSNLYIGALRMYRGERLAAMTLIERDALTNLLLAYRKKYDLPVEDPFNVTRRAELTLQVDFGDLLHGYCHLERSLEAILAFAENHFDVNANIASVIRNLQVTKGAGL